MDSSEIAEVEGVIRRENRRVQQTCPPEERISSRTNMKSRFAGHELRVLIVIRYFSSVECPAPVSDAAAASSKKSMLQQTHILPHRPTYIIAGPPSITGPIEPALLPQRIVFNTEYGENSSYGSPSELAGVKICP